MRYITDLIKKDWDYNKMVFIGGPRQVGKTTLALSFLGENASEDHPAYLNWDHLHARERLLAYDLPSQEPILILDEIHKFPDWRNFLKGLYDKGKSKHRFIITGSARLDYYRYSGDSLFGRYLHYRLHPFSPSEMGPNSIEALLQFGGFPEPLFRRDDSFLRRWQNERSQKVIGEDLSQLEHVVQVAKVQLLATMLPSRVGSLLSLNSLAEDLGISPKTVDRWLEIFEALYFSYRIAPFGQPELVKALKKEKKIFLWDWSTIKEKGPRFENMVASFLLKYCHLEEDRQGYKMDLRYLRDKEKREIDFVVLRDSLPIFAVEVKAGEREFSKHLSYFHQRTSIPYFYQVHLGAEDYTSLNGPFRRLPIATFCDEILGI